jgi:hypothetical protein
LSWRNTAWKGVKFIAADVPAIYDSIPEIIEPDDPTGWGDVIVKENEMIVIASITDGAGARDTGDIVGVFHSFKGELRGRATVQNIAGTAFCVITIYYDEDEIDNTLVFKLYCLSEEEELESTDISAVAEGVTGSIASPEVLLFSTGGAGT